MAPGAFLMSMCAHAAYSTISDDFVLDNLQSHFLGATKPDEKISFKVDRLSNGKKFAVRSVITEQNGKGMLSATLSFVKTEP